MRVRIKVQPSGLINGSLWPEVGEVLELSDAVAEDMETAGWVEVVKGAPKTEKRPAATKNVETRQD
jgi:hypothetical protein